MKEGMKEEQESAFTMIQHEDTTNETNEEKIQKIRH